MPLLSPPASAWTTAGERLRNSSSGRRRVASLSLLSALLLACGAIYRFDGAGYAEQRVPASRRSLQLQEAAILSGDDRNLAVRASPPTDDEISNQFVVKPYVGTAATSIWESRADTRLAVSSAQASTNQGTAFSPKNAIDDGVASRWRSAVSAHATQTEWLSIDLGMPQTVREVYIDWSDAYARDYRIQVRSRGERRVSSPCCFLFGAIVICSRRELLNGRPGRLDSVVLFANILLEDVLFEVDVLWPPLKVVLLDADVLLEVVSWSD